MPRHNKTQPHVRKQIVGTSEVGKQKYRTKQAALQAIKRAKMYNPDLALQAYQSHTDGAWYLTSKTQDT